MRFISYFSLLCKESILKPISLNRQKYNFYSLWSQNISKKVKFPLSTESFAKLHLSCGLYAKSFQEKENEYAHSVLENLPAYRRSIVTQPLLNNSLDSLTFSSRELQEFAKEMSKEKPTRPDSETCLVFVYGTLKINEPNYDQMSSTSNRKATYVGLGKTIQKWPLVIASRYNIPYLLYKEGVGKNVLGEIFRVDEAMLSHMDRFEDHPNYYTREQIEVELLEPPDQRKIVTPWAYFLKNFRPELLERPFLENYRSKGDHGLEYVTRYYRTQGENYYSDIKM